MRSREFNMARPPCFRGLTSVQSHFTPTADLATCWGGSRVTSEITGSVISSRDLSLTCLSKRIRPFRSRPTRSATSRGG